MKQSGMKLQGFTLIELLVVIAIIALLLAIVMPSLKAAREVSKRLFCMSSIRMLTTAWNTYASENGGELAEAKTADVAEVSSNPPRYSWSFTTIHPRPTWTGIWRGSVDNKNALEGAIQLGTFYPYNDTLKIYRCTNHEVYALHSTEPDAVKRIRSYAIVDSMNGYYLKDSDGSVKRGIPFKKISELTNTGKQIVFIDEGRETSEGWTIYPDRQQWWDLPPIQHSNGGIFSFADNHAEYWKWEDEHTIQYVEYNYFKKGAAIDAAQAALKNADFDRVQMGIWGTRRGI